MKRSALVSESLKVELAFSYNVTVALEDGEASTWGARAQLERCTDKNDRLILFLQPSSFDEA